MSYDVIKEANSLSVTNLGEELLEKLIREILTLTESEWEMLLEKMREMLEK